MIPKGESFLTLPRPLPRSQLGHHCIPLPDLLKPFNVLVRPRHRRPERVAVVRWIHYEVTDSGHIVENIMFQY